MRPLLLLVLASISFLSLRAQTHEPGERVNYLGNTPTDSTQINKKWYVSKYVGISSGFVFANGVAGSFLSVPVGLQLNHPLNNNLVAFAGVSAGPMFFSRSSFTNPYYNKFYPAPRLPNGYGFGVNTRVDMGLMYTNDARTFSISGSIGIDRYSYPVYQPARVNPGGNPKK